MGRFRLTLATCRRRRLTVSASGLCALRVLLCQELDRTRLEPVYRRTQRTRRSDAEREELIKGVRKSLATNGQVPVDARNLQSRSFDRLCVRPLRAPRAPVPGIGPDQARTGLQEDAEDAEF